MLKNIKNINQNSCSDGMYVPSITLKFPLDYSLCMKPTNKKLLKVYTIPRFCASAFIRLRTLDLKKTVEF